MGKLVAIVCIAFMLQFSHQLSLAAQPSSDTYDKDLQNERAKLINYVDRLRSFIANSNDISARTTNSKVSFRVSDEGVPNAWVSQSTHGGPITVQITAEYRLLAVYLADAEVVSFLDNTFAPCQQSYMASLFKVLASNRQRIASGEKPRRIPAPEVFLRASDDVCRQFQNRFPIDKKYREGRDNAVNEVMGLSYLHELGHVANGHTMVDLSSLDKLPSPSERLAGFVRLMERSREQEYQADAWAIDRLVDLSNNPLEALSNVLLTFYMSFSGLDCSMEAADSHPNGYQRFAKQMLRMKDRAIVSGKIHQNSQAVSVIDDLLHLASKAQAQLECPHATR